MLRAGAELEHEVQDVLGIVSVKTYRQWLREAKAGRETGRVGHPKLAASVRKLIIRLAKENVGWGLRRIVGELKKLALKPGRSTVRRVLIDEGTRSQSPCAQGRGHALADVCSRACQFDGRL